MKTKRILNFLIDGVFIQLISFFIIFILIIISKRNNKIMEIDSDTILFPTYIFYYFCSECIFYTSIGKWITKTKVIDKEGNVPSLFQMLKRNFLRTLIPIDLISFLFNEEGTGFHDKYSNTVLVNKE